MAKAWSEKMAPAMPLMKTSGTKTATVVSDDESIGVIISTVPFTQLSISGSPRWRYCCMFSVTITELSIIMPTANIMPDIEMMLIETPNR